MEFPAVEIYSYLTSLAPSLRHAISNN